MEFKEITWDNLWDVLALKVNETQKKFVADNAVFLAQAYVNVKYGYPDSCFAIYEKSELVGFTKVVYVPSCEEAYNFKEDCYMIDVLMIDKKYQKHGFGKKALKMILQYIESCPFGEYDSIKLLCNDENINAIHVYHSFGFISTDVIIRGRRLFTRNKT
ncbi:GNAT family N-acetyltransferase [Bacillus sp. HMF5848]|uniref:GNAT family N-acetyltransferase n=1 Tax=Bacillus sp. HMF5848 TaxID=2495421 RepID=UPI00163A9084|nr:GNAT family N-acetyltransferase [Bacillus sp. HMF5848]